MTADGEEDRLGGRVKRYAQVTSAVGGLAARLAGEKLLGRKADSAAMASELRVALGGLKGPLMKVAQMLSTIPDALPPEFSRELAQLQSDAPRMGWPFVKRRMAGELGADWQARFASFERESVAAASLGQVHRAVGLDGRKLACKLQYPDMSSTVAADLQQLRLIFAIGRRYDRSIDPADFYAEIAERLAEELDYRREAANMALYRLMLAQEEGTHVPDSIPDLCTDRLLTMSWLDGRRMMSCVGAPQEIRDQVAYNLFRAWYVPFYSYGVIHGDPHLGNYSVHEDQGINLLDFGCIRVFPPRFVQGVIDLYRALETQDADLAVHAYESWGFGSLTKETIEVLNRWAAFLYGPLLEDRARPIQELESGPSGRAVVENVQAELRQVGGIKPPREFVLMERAAVGLGSVFVHLKAEINWHRLFQQLIQDFDPAALERRQNDAVQKAGLAAMGGSV